MSINVGEILLKLWNDSGFAALFSGFLAQGGWQNLVMIIIACVLLYLAIVKKFGCCGNDMELQGDGHTI